MANLTLMQPWLGTMPRCADDVPGMCVEEPTSGKGVVLHYDYKTCSGAFINLPGINLLETWLLGVMWGLFLMWAFFGVSLISDSFMDGIMVITSTTRKFKRHDARGNVVYVEEPVWNWAVANITLMALGTSSPEILLSLVETLLTLNSRPGELGASCIVGSASYNLNGITAICIIALPAGVFKRIEHTKVFWWSTSWSLWAYIWLYLVYKQISPDVVELWEAWVTLGFMPLFVFTTWLVDTRGWNWFAPHKNAIVPDTTPADEEEGTKEGAKDVDAATLALPAAHNPALHSIMYYRQLAVQRMAGGTVPHDSVSPRASKVDAESPVWDLTRLDDLDHSVTKVLMSCAETSVLESAGVAKLQVTRMHGDLNSKVLVHYTCRDNTAVTGLDYEPAEGTLVFLPGETVQQIAVKILDDDMSEPDVQFTVTITSAEVEGGGKVQVLRKESHVTIVDDDDGGVLVFELPTWEAGVEDTHAQVTVVRRSGADGRVTVDYCTKDGSAVSGKHFGKVEGTLVFNAGETRQTIQVPLLPANVSAEDAFHGTLAFRLVLGNPMGGAVLGARKDCRVVLVPGSKGRKGGGIGADDKSLQEGEYNLWSAWQDRFRDIMLPQHDPEEGNVWIDIMLHYITITYKLIVACIPPPEWKSGYPCFVISLLVLCGLMAVVKEVADMFGCAMGLSELMTGISIVAMGTSLPDTFASRLAAIHDETADAAIGNITGSNCVNVFLGLGIPWVIATAYYQVLQKPYRVAARALGFSVLVFTLLAVGAIILIRVRRWQGGELGGGKLGQWISFTILMSFWLLFLILAGLLDYNNITSVV